MILHHPSISYIIDQICALSANPLPILPADLNVLSLSTSQLDYVFFDYAISTNSSIRLIN